MNPKKNSRPAVILLLLLLPLTSYLFLLTSCASQQPPPGGPLDTIKPKIDSIWPRERSLNVSRKPELYLEFNQDIDEASFGQAFSIAPYVNTTPKFHWSGFRKVRVEFPDSLRDSTTYTMQLTRDLKTHAAAGGSPRGGQLPAPFFLTFSTGPNIDTGSLSGFLLVPMNAPPMKPSSLFLMAYDLSVQKEDTLNFATTPPDLLTQPNDQGIWQFLAMKVGHRYRVFALADVYRNKLYDAGIDAFGVPASDAILDSAVKKGVYIRMAPPIDTVKPELTDAEAIDSFHVRAHFSELIDSESVRAENFTIGGEKIVAAFRNDKKPNQVLLVVNAPLSSSKEYSLEAIRDSIRDLSENPLGDSAYKVIFTSPENLRSPDTTKFLTANLKDSARDVAILPSFPIQFSDAVNRDSAERSVKLVDTSHQAVPISFRWYDDSKVSVQPKDSLLSNVFYTLEIYTAEIRSPVPGIPHPWKDTVFRFRFRTQNAHDFGKMQGTVSIADSFFAAPKSAVVVQVLQNDLIVTQQILLHGTKAFEFDRLPAATYRVRAYLSRDGTGKYDPGSVRPWSFSVPTGEYPKPVDIRPRWTADVDFDLK